jgi:hypothetical protein
MKAIPSSIVLLLLTLAASAGTASAGTLDVQGVIDRVDVRVSVAPVKAQVERLPTTASVSTGWSSGSAANVSARRSPINLDVRVGCIAARVESPLASARVGLCRERPDPGAALAAADVVKSRIAAAIGCLRLAGVSGHLRGHLLAGTCGESGSAADTHGGLGGAVADGAVGCVAGNAAGDHGMNVAAAVGTCQEGGGAPAPTPGDDPGEGANGGNKGDGGDVAGETAGKTPGGVLAAVTGSDLPYTGLPLWAMGLTGLGLIGLGVLFRRRPELART